MQFAIICPISTLNRYATLSSVHLVLPQIQSQEYWDFYRRRRERGDLIILDNGAYEAVNQTTVIERMMKVYKDLNPQVLVLPDRLLSNEIESLDCSAQAYRAVYLDLRPETSLMYVPQAQAGDHLGWWAGVNEFGKHDLHYKVSWLGIPRALATHIARDPLARVLAARSLKRLTGYRLHALGMVQGNFHELHYLSHEKVFSCDSSAPVWRGMCGQRLQDTIGQNFDIDFNHNHNNDPVIDNLILENLEVVGVKRRQAKRA